MLTSLPKPRPDSKLKILPDSRQAEIAEFARTHSLAQTVKWLAQSQLQTSTSALSQFLRWYRTLQDMAKSEANLQAQLADIVRNDPSSTAEQLHKVGTAFFTATALQQQDPNAWCRAQSIGIRRDQLYLDHGLPPKSIKEVLSAISAKAGIPNGPEPDPAPEPAPGGPENPLGSP